MLPPATLSVVGFKLCPFPAFAPSGRNLTALLPEICDLVGSLYLFVLNEFVLPVAILSQRRRDAFRGADKAMYPNSLIIIS
jgi:hypothetical protein